MTTPFKVKALFEYKSDFDDDLTFAPDQIITVTEIENDEWYSGTYGGKLGMFPKNFVEIYVEEEPPVKVPTLRPISLKLLQASGTAPIVSTGASDSSKTLSSTVAPIGEGGQFQESASKSETGYSEKKTDPLEIKSDKPIAAVATPKVPIPGLVMPGKTPLQRDDPYAVKKQFFGAGKSSYVPQVKPRDQSNIISHAYHDVAKNTEIVREHDANNDEEEAAEEPKMSLKERIAMLQKRQQEEAEREAAALKRREERKKEKLIQKNTTGSSVHTAASEEIVVEAETEIGSPELHPSIPEVTQAVPTQEVEREIGGEADVEVEEDAQGGEDEEAEGVEGEETEEDDEDLRRRKLVERMAKISGGRNMFGMMGMPAPFGAPAAAPTRSKAESKPKVAKEETTNALPNAIPIPGMSVASEIPAILKESNVKEEVDESDVGRSVSVPNEEVINESDSPDEDNIPLDHSTRNFEVVENQPRPPSLKLSESEGEEQQEIDLSISNIGNDPEVTGYEADEDVSDRAATADVDAQNTTEGVQAFLSARSPSLAKVPPPPPHSQHPLVAEPPSHPERPPVPDTLPLAKAPPIPVVEGADYITPLSPSAPPPIALKVPQMPPIPQAVPPTTALPPPPVPSQAPVTTSEVIADYNDTSDDGFEDIAEALVNDGIDYGEHPPATPRRASTYSHPPPVPTLVPSMPGMPSRMSTSSSIGRRSIDSGLRSTELGRSKSVKEGKSDQLQAEAHLVTLQNEVQSLAETSGWWLRDDIPDSLQSKVGTDLVFEVDSNQVTKRGNKTVVYKDYYILFHDLSQIVVELLYCSDDPRTSAKIINVSVVNPSSGRKDILHKYNALYGNDIVALALRLVGTKVPTGLVVSVFGLLYQKFPNLLMPIGEKSFGATIYKNFNHNIVNIDEIRPGDILCIRNAKFSSHKGLGGIGNKSIVVGDGPHIYSAVIAEYDSKKEKLRVFESDHSGVVKKDSYKISDMKSGHIRVFRVVDRAFVGWA